MTLYPRDLQQRWRETIQGIQGRLRTLEHRTAGIDSGWPLMAVPAQIDPGYASGDPMAYINGAGTLTGPYQHLASYTPAASDQVIALPVVATRTYVILGRLT